MRQPVSSTPDENNVVDTADRSGTTSPDDVSLECVFDDALPGILMVRRHGRKLIHPWGLEFAGRDFFFSINEARRGLLATNVETRRVDRNRWETSARVRARNGQVSISIDEAAGDRSISRSATLTPDGQVEVTGMALRFQFAKEFYSRAAIANRTIEHAGSGLYHMFEVDGAELIGRGHRVRIGYSGGSIPSGMKRFTYVRDLPDRWIVHLRVLPDPACASTIRMVRLPSRLDRVDGLGLLQRAANASLTLTPLWNFLWHRVERIRSPVVPLGAYGLVQPGAGVPIEIRSEAVFTDE